jgi:uncharacterized membrane protein YdbT with pleckstrin-like domain
MAYVNNLMGRNERMVFLTRQHWIQLVPVGLMDLVFIGGLIILGAVVLHYLESSLGMIIALVLALIPLGHFARRFAWWWNEQYIVTNRRVIQVEGILDKHVIDSSLEKVNDVVLRQSAFGRALDYGDIEILTGSEIGVNELTRIYHPIRFKTEMLNQKESMGEIDAFETRTKRVLASEAPTAGDIPELIAELDELRKKKIITQAEFDKKKKDLLDRL